MRSDLRLNHMVGDQASASLLPSVRLPTPPINYRGTTSVQCTDVYPNNWLKPLSASIPSSSPSRDTIHVIIQRRRCCRMRHHHPVRKSAVGKRLALAPWRLDMGTRCAVMCFCLASQEEATSDRQIDQARAAHSAHPLCSRRHPS
jgi:hypothetical protein